MESFLTKEWLKDFILNEMGDLVDLTAYQIASIIGLDSDSDRTRLNEILIELVREGFFRAQISVVFQQVLQSDKPYSRIEFTDYDILNQYEADLYLNQGIIIHQRTGKRFTNQQVQQFGYIAACKAYFTLRANTEF